MVMFKWFWKRKEYARGNNQPPTLSRPHTQELWLIAAACCPEAFCLRFDDIPVSQQHRQPSTTISIISLYRSLFSLSSPPPFLPLPTSVIHNQPLLLFNRPESSVSFRALELILGFVKQTKKTKLQKIPMGVKIWRHYRDQLFESSAHPGAILAISHRYRFKGNFDLNTAPGYFANSSGRLFPPRHAAALVRRGQCQLWRGSIN